MQADLIIPYFPDIATNHRRGDSEDRGTLTPRQEVSFFGTVGEVCGLAEVTWHAISLHIHHGTEIRCP